MAIKVTRSDEAIKVETLCFTIYSQPGLGKTSLAFTASRPLLLDFDKGAHRAVDRKDTVQVSDWRDVASITVSDVAAYDTIIIDTVGKALDTLAQDVIRTNSRLSHGGALSQQGWGQLGVRFSAFLKMLRGFGKDVVLITHMDEQKDGDSIKERLKISGGSKDLVLTDSDVIARISIISKQRYLVFSPTETAFGKDPAGISEMPVPSAGSAEYATCLAGVIASIKEKMNALSEDQVARKAEHEWFISHLPTVADAEGLNMVLSRAKLAGREVAAMVHDRSKDLGLVFDKAAGRYMLPQNASRPSSAEMKRKLEEITQDLMDCPTMEDVRRCEAIWGTLMDRDNWPADFREIALQRFKQQRDAIAKDRQFRADDEFPGDFPGSDDIRQHPLNAG